MKEKKAWPMKTINSEDNQLMKIGQCVMMMKDSSKNDQGMKMLKAMKWPMKLGH